MVLTLVVNEPPAGGLLMNSADERTIAADFNTRLAPSREAFRAGDMRNAVRIFADAVGGSGTYDHRSEAVRQMMLDNALAHAADARSARPRPVFTCDGETDHDADADHARLTQPVLLWSGYR